MLNESLTYIICKTVHKFMILRCYILITCIRLANGADLGGFLR